MTGYEPCGNINAQIVTGDRATYEHVSAIMHEAKERDTGTMSEKVIMGLFQPL